MKYVDYGVLKPNALNQKKKKRKKIVLFASGLVAASIIGIFGYAFYWPISNLIGQILKDPGSVLSFFRDPSGELKSTDGKTNFLILGIDKRSNVPYTYLGPSGKQEHNGFLSDTIIVASVDLTTKKAVMISVPRDTWVSIPGWSGFPASEGKINSTYSLGDMYGHPGGGLNLAKKVVSSHLGIPVHYAIRVDFESFIKSVDTLGGLDIVVEKTFDDYKYPVAGKEAANCFGGGYNCRFEHIHFDAGKTHMDGETALKYARSRSGTNGEGSDFARARRQQRVIQAFVKKATSLENLLDPFKLNSLFKNLGETVETDFDLASLPALAKLSKEVHMGSIQTMVLDPSSGLMQTPSATLYGGAYVIIPKNGWEEIKTRVREFLDKTSPEEEK
ncbi:MAG: LCP family protein [Candidatus Woykebacteria bacterium]